MLLFPVLLEISRIDWCIFPVDYAIHVLVSALNSSIIFTTVGILPLMNTIDILPNMDKSELAAALPGCIGCHLLIVDEKSNSLARGGSF